MKMKKYLLSFMSILGIGLIASCSKVEPPSPTSIIPIQTRTSNQTLPITPTTTTTTSTTQSKDYYTEKEIDVIYSSGKEKAKIRYYAESAEIPYLGLKEYYKILLKHTDSNELAELSVTTSNNINYLYRTVRGATLELDTDENTLFSKNLTNFTNNSSFLETAEVSCYDGLPWLKIESTESNLPPNATYIDFDDYYIDIHPGIDDVYLPVQLLNDLFTGMNLIYSAYNNKSLYIINGEKEEDLMTKALLTEYNEDLFKTPLSKTYYEYSYYETCFFYDNLAGRPARCSLEFNYDLANGLDKALESTELGLKIKEYMTSGDLSDYLVGAQILGSLFNDGGHSVYDINYATYGTQMPSWATNEVLESVYAKIAEIRNKNYPELVYVRDNNVGESLSTVRNFRAQMLNKGQKLSGANSYTANGDIAIISIDDFMTDYYNKELWVKYYNGELLDIPYDEEKGGAVAALFKGLERARNDENIKNVLIDIGANGGGSTDELMFLISLLAGAENNKLYFTNQITRQQVITSYKIDRNLDRKFDEADDEFDAVGDLNILVLSSTASFSCGGVSPVYLHDYGLKVIGDNCGGGACAIVKRTDGVGIVNVFASPYNILSPNRKASIDYERKYLCDYMISHPQTEVDGKVVNDYSSFYDFNILSGIFNQFFKTDEEE